MMPLPWKSPPSRRTMISRLEGCQGCEDRSGAWVVRRSTLSVSSLRLLLLLEVEEEEEDDSAPHPSAFHPDHQGSNRRPSPVTTSRHTPPGSRVPAPAASTAIAKPAKRIAFDVVLSNNVLCDTSVRKRIKLALCKRTFWRFFSTSEGFDTCLDEDPRKKLHCSQLMSKYTRAN